MTERGSYESLGGDLVHSAFAAACSRCLAFEIRNRCLDTRAVSGHDFVGSLLRTQRVQQRDGLRRPEGEIESRDALSFGLMALGQPVSRLWMETVEDGSQVRFANWAGKAELLRTPGEPVAGRFPGADIVVLDSLRHGVQVVELAALAELANIEHKASDGFAVATHEVTSRVYFEFADPETFLGLFWGPGSIVKN
jgi:hypothetical protein